jgi:hypothetical protein
MENDGTSPGLEKSLETPTTTTIRSRNGGDTGVKSEKARCSVNTSETRW